MFKAYMPEISGELKKILVLLPGRGQSASHFIAQYNSVPEGYKVMALEPIDEWYPAPFGSEDQEDAVWGLKVTVPELNDFLSKRISEYGLSLSDVVLVGFSAGAVVAIQAAAYSDSPYGGVISHCGAILSPDDLPPNKHNTPILLIHAKNDDCFSWEERYLPMRESLKLNGYNVTTAENECRGHSLYQEDVKIAMNFLLN